MSTHVPGFQSFFRLLHDFVLAQLATSRERVNSIVVFKNITDPHKTFHSIGTLILRGIDLMSDFMLAFHFDVLT